MRLYLLLGLGAVAGAISRYQVGLWLAGPVDAFPWGTFFINLTGSFLVGFLARLLLHSPVDHDVRIMLTVGFCGAYTTFSTFSIETITLLTNGETATAFSYVGASAILAPVACWLGYLVVGYFSPAP